MDSKIVILIDMDCFYVQVEERDYPEIKQKPAAVVQYNEWKGGGIIAVNYEARHHGIKRGMRGQDAQEKFADIHLIQVPVQRGKSDLTKYRNAGKEVVSVLCEFSDCVERASIDEVYIDITNVIDDEINRLRTSMAKKKTVSPPSALTNFVDANDLHSTWVVSFDSCNDEEQLSNEEIRERGIKLWLTSFQNDENSIHSEPLTDDDLSVRLALAAKLSEKMRKAVLDKTGFKCSAGISCNKMLAKLSCGLHKPNQQTICPPTSVPILWSKTPVGKVRNLGGKLGDSITTDFDCKTMLDLSNLSLTQLQSKYDEKTSRWLQLLGQGVDHEAVVARLLPKSVGCGKNFNGKQILDSVEKVKKWLKCLVEELVERLIEDQLTNNRVARSVSVSVRTGRLEKGTVARSCRIFSYDFDALFKDIFNVLSSLNNCSSNNSQSWQPALRNISLSAGKFIDDISSKTTKIDSIFKKIKSPMSLPPPSTQNYVKKIRSCDMNSSFKNFKKDSKTVDSKFERMSVDSLRAGPSRIVDNQYEDFNVDIDSEIRDDFGELVSDDEFNKPFSENEVEINKIETNLIKNVSTGTHRNNKHKQADKISEVTKNNNGKTIKPVRQSFFMQFMAKNQDKDPTILGDSENFGEEHVDNSVKLEKGTENFEILEGKNRELDKVEDFLNENQAMEKNDVLEELCESNVNTERKSRNLRNTHDAKSTALAKKLNVTDSSDNLNCISEDTQYLQQKALNSPLKQHGNWQQKKSEEKTKQLQPNNDKEIQNLHRNESENSQLLLQKGDIKNIPELQSLKSLEIIDSEEIVCIEEERDESEIVASEQTVQLSGENIACENSEYVEIEELFPDLDNIDESVVEILPQDLKMKLRKAVQKHKMGNSNLDFKILETKRNDDNKEKTELMPTSSCLSDLNSLSRYPQNKEKIGDLKSPDSKRLNTVSNSSNPSSKRFKAGFQLCRECNRSICESDYVQHLDYHFALKLRKEQLQERCSDIVQNKSSNMGPKTKNKSKSSRNEGPGGSCKKIDDFFKKK